VVGLVLMVLALAGFEPPAAAQIYAPDYDARVILDDGAGTP
jgi:hypothetical protein